MRAGMSCGTRSRRIDFASLALNAIRTPLSAGTSPNNRAVTNSQLFLDRRRHAVRYGRQ
jgi:hypothetical protein